MRCDRCGAEGAEPAILEIREDDGELREETHLMLCVVHTGDLVNAVEAKES